MVFSFPFLHHSEDIDFHQPNWFEQYCAFRKKFPPEVMLSSPQIWMGQQQDTTYRKPDEQYQLMLNSGLIYGFPFIYPLQPQPNSTLPPKVANQLLLLDLLWYSILTSPVKEEPSVLIREFYQGMNNQVSSRTTSLETLISDHVNFSSHWLNWGKKGVNTHLFWDWYLFQEYLLACQHGALSAALFELLRRRQKYLQGTTLRLIAAAIHSDAQVRHREKILDHYFVDCNQLFTGEETQAFRHLFRDGLALEDVEIPEKGTLAARYWLDVTLLVLSADQNFHPQEYIFVRQLMELLQLKDEDLVQSQLILGGFIYRFGRKIPFLNSRKISLLLISRALSDNFRTMKYATQAEYQETVQMATTFGHLLQHHLGLGKEKKMPTEQELKAAFTQLKDVPKFLPFFTVFFVPVPGLTESYILLAYTIERLTGNSIRLLPSNFSRIIKERKKK